MTFHRSLWAVFATVTVVGPSSVAMAERSVQPQVPELEARVDAALANEETLSNVSAAVDGDVVTLSGVVSSVGVKERAAEIVLEVDGVGSIVSDLVIAGAESDAQVGQLAVALIRRYGFFSVFDDLNVEVQDGAVRLTGEVTEPHKKTDIEKLVSNIGGVREIDNQIEVLPVSGVDDRLRREIASLIYGDPLFSRYTEVTHPPIHIIVKRGRVRLTGVVISAVEREFAAMIARQVDGVRSFRNELRLESSQ